MLVLCCCSDLMVVRSTTACCTIYGWREGKFYHSYSGALPMLEPNVWFRLNPPKFGDWPEWETKYERWIGPVETRSAPIWLPLSVMFGRLVIRELRWREKLAKADERPEKESAPETPISAP